MYPYWSLLVDVIQLITLRKKKPKVPRGHSKLTSRILTVNVIVKMTKHKNKSTKHFIKNLT